MTHTAFHTCCDSAHDASVQTHRLSTVVRAALDWLKRAYSVHLQRRSLLKLSDHQLNDIGLDRDTAMREAARPFWDLP